MDQKQIAKQMVEFNKAAFDNSFTAMTALQDQTEKLITGFLDKAAWLPRKGRRPSMTGSQATRKVVKILKPPLMNATRRLWSILPKLKNN